MSQPTAYVKATNFAQDESANVGGRSTVRTDRVDAELANIETTLGETLDNLALIQRDDGQLTDGLVEYYNLSSSCKAAVLATKWTSRGLWATATAYVVNDMVDVAGSSYICAIAHTSGTFATDYAAGKWQIFVAASTAGGVSFTPTTTVTSTTAQAAIEEVDTKLRAASLPVLSALYGAL
jgi:hypothetical protein